MEHIHYLPWRYEEHGFGKGAFYHVYADVYNNAGTKMFFLMDLDDARRIVACVNKLAGWSIEDLEDEAITVGQWRFEEGQPVAIDNITWVEID